MTEATKDALLKVYRVLAEIGKPPTNNYVFAIVRGSRHRFTDKEGKDVLAQARSQGRAPGPPLDSRSHAPGPPDAAPASRARRSQRNLDIVPYVQGELVPSPNGLGRAGKPAPSAPEWVGKISEAVTAMQDRNLLELDPDDLFLVARHHAARFAYCRKVERTNRANARKVAASLANLRDYLERQRIDVTVGEYFSLAARFHAKLGGSPWYAAADVRTEFRAVPV